MPNQSFRDILAGFLEEKEANPPLENAVSPEFHAVFTTETPSFHWENVKPAGARAGKTFPYPKAKIPAEKIAAAPAAPLPPEPKWLVSQLNLADQRQIKILVQMGANEINGEISLSALKKAHRRLARKLHPDAIPAAASPAQKKKSQEDFLALQSIYECLTEVLSARACGNESASEQASPRRDAA